MDTIKVYIDGDIVEAKVIERDEITYISPILRCIVLEGKFKNKKISVFENGDRHVKQ